MINIAKLNITKYRRNEYWDHGNRILYKLCRDNFKHTNDGEIITKVLFIGRIYAAAIERRKLNGKGKLPNDKYYTKKVTTAFKKSNIDLHLATLKKNTKLEPDNFQRILETHSYLTDIIHDKLTKDNKRSFSSKYLHFHLPNLFFIYDSRTVKALSTFGKLDTKHFISDLEMNSLDSSYVKFFCTCYLLKKKIESIHKTKLTNRQFDNLLIDVTG